MKRTTLVGAVLLCCACQGATQGDPAADRTAVAAAMQHYGRLIKMVNADSFAAMYTADAELLDPEAQPLRGRKAIHDFLADFNGKARVDTVGITSDTIELFGRAAYQWGSYYQVTSANNGPATPYAGRYVARWQKEDDGQWRIAKMLMQPGPR